MLIRTFVVQAFKIPSGSMEPTLEIGDHILVNKFIFGIKIPFTSWNLLPFQKPKKGDVVVFIYPNNRDKDFIKRVAAVEGDTVQIINKKLHINGKPVPDPHAVFKETGPLAAAIQKGDNFGPVRVPPRKRSLSWGTIGIAVSTAVSGALFPLRMSGGKRSSSIGPGTARAMPTGIVWTIRSAGTGLAI